MSAKGLHLSEALPFVRGLEWEKAMKGFVGRLAALAGVAALVVVVTGVGTAAAVPPEPCADVMPLSDVAAGMMGTGYTVAVGTDPETFDVEVLGVMEDLIVPGRDVIVVKISGPLVDDVGVWAGMSGSPVYIDDGGGPQLVGALAYGFSFGPSAIAGLTPAEDMLTVAGYPASTARLLPKRVELSRSLLRAIATSTGTSLVELDDNLVRLKLPVSVSGVSAERMGSVRKLLKRQHVGSIPYAGSSVSASAVSTVDSLVPGGNFSAALSYGDLTFAAVGTTTYVCDGTALAFGHPFLLTGRSSLGAGSAEALTVVPDAFGAYKLANVSAPIGRLDQDRWAGVRAVDGDISPIPIETAVSSLDTGLARVGETDVLLKSEFPFLAFAHLFSNIDSVFDQIGAGSSSLDWTIHGTRSDGTPWELHKTNRYTSDFDLSIDSSIELLDELYTFTFNPFDKVKFTGVEATASVEDVPKSYELTSLLVCRRGICEETSRIRAERGQTINLRAILTPSDGSEPETVDLSFTIPPRMHAGGLIQVGAPGLPSFCFAPDECSKVVESFEQLVRVYRRHPSNNVLTGTLRGGYRGGVKQRTATVFDQVIVGSKWVSVFLPGECCPPEPEGFDDDEGFFFGFFRK